MKLFQKNIGFLSQSDLYFTEEQKGLKSALILSPYFYWHFQEKLPTNKLTKAKKIAPQVVQSKLPEGKFEYYVFPTETEKLFDVFAFDRKFLEQHLETISYDSSKISHISFSALELPREQLIKAGDSCIASENGIFFELQNSLSYEQGNALPIKEMLKSKTYLNHKIGFNRGSFLEEGFQFAEQNGHQIAAIFVIASFGILAKVLYHYNLQSELQTKIDSLMVSQTYADHPAQLKYISRELAKTDRSQMAIREDINRIFSMSSTNNTYLTKAIYNLDKGWTVHIAASDKQSAEALLKNINVRFVSFQGGIYTFEIAQ